MSHLREISFFQRFESDILAGKKTITIRDESEKHFVPGSIVAVKTFEQDRYFCRVKIESICPIHFDQIDTQHAAQENMTLSELKALIGQIYPDTEQLYVIDFSVSP